MFTYPDGATPLDPDEMEGLKYKHVTTRSELDHLEQGNIQLGIDWMRKTKRKDILSASFIVALHEKLFGEVWSWAGSYRRSGKNIGIDPIYIQVELRKLIDDATYWLENETFTADQMALRFHHRCVAIHPFPNGNGRHARIMADAILLKLYQKPGIDWSGGFELSAMNTRRQEYIGALRAADMGNYEKLFHFAKMSVSDLPA